MPNKVIDTQNGLPTIRNWVKSQIRNNGDSLTGTPSDSADTLTLNGVKNRVDQKIEALDSEAEAGPNSVLSAITITDGKITSKKEVNLDSSCQTDEDNVLTGVKIVNGKITEYKQTNLNSEVTTSDGTVLTGLTIKNGKIVSHKEFSVQGIYKFQGSVDTEEDLPTNAQNGFVYNIVARSSYGDAGMNVAWVANPAEAGGGHWDKLGSGTIIDYASAEEVLNILNEEPESTTPTTPTEPSDTGETTDTPTEPSDTGETTDTGTDTGETTETDTPTETPETPTNEGEQ